MEKKLQKVYLTYYNLLIAQDLHQANYQYKYCNCFLENTNYKDDFIKYKCLCCKKKYQQKLDKKLKE